MEKNIPVESAEQDVVGGFSVGRNIRVQGVVHANGEEVFARFHGGSQVEMKRVVPADGVLAYLGSVEPDGGGLHRALKLEKNFAVEPLGRGLNFAPVPSDVSALLLESGQIGAKELVGVGQGGDIPICVVELRGGGRSRRIAEMEAPHRVEAQRDTPAVGRAVRGEDREGGQGESKNESPPAKGRDGAKSAHKLDLSHLLAS
jgi:hypothetical protein